MTRLLGACERLLVLTGAGCSTASGIPEYRDERGCWKGADPVYYQDFVADPGLRQRYWARSLKGFERMAGARPNGAHQALAELEARGSIDLLITQNVDGLHARAGSRKLLELHGNLAKVVCLSCRKLYDRFELQQRLKAMNPDFEARVTGPRPDGDAELAAADYGSFAVPDCARCGGILKPDVVFFGEAVPRTRGRAALAAVAGADGVLVVGSSLMLRSGYRLVREAARRGLRVVAINLGTTRADELLEAKITGRCETVLGELVARLRLETAPAQRLD